LPKLTKPTRLHTLFVLALFMGPRRGEPLGLQWADIDWVERPWKSAALCSVSMGSKSRDPEDEEVSADGAAD